MEAVPGVNPAREFVHLPHAIETLLISWIRDFTVATTSAILSGTSTRVPTALGNAADSMEICFAFLLPMGYTSIKQYLRDL